MNFHSFFLINNQVLGLSTLFTHPLEIGIRFVKYQFLSFFKPFITTMHFTYHESATTKPLIAPFTVVHGTQTDLLDRMGNVLFFLFGLCTP